MLFTAFQKNCPHCSDNGFVLMNDQPLTANVADPCPMCRAGQRVALQFTTGAIGSVPRDDGSMTRHPIEQWQNRLGLPDKDADGWFKGTDLSAVSWNGGLTLRHTYWCNARDCFDASTGGVCSSCRPKRSIDFPTIPEIARAAIEANERGLPETGIIDVIKEHRANETENAA